MNFKRLTVSFRDALRGLKFVFKNEQNFRIQILISIFILSLLFVLGVKKSESIVILLLVTLVLILEILNSAVEKFADIIKPRLHEQVKIVKDILAAMVLFTSVMATIIGILIFWPYILQAVMYM